jgi:hypothetical protein
MPVSRTAVEAPTREGKVEKKMKRRREVPEDAVSRVRDTVIAMEKKLIYLHLAPQIVMGQLKTKRRISETVDVIFRGGAAS